MAITINVTGNVTGGGSQQQNNKQSQDGSYQRPDYQQYLSSSGSSSSLPTSDAIIQDIKREIASRGVILVPNSNNFSSEINSIRNQQRATLTDRIDTSAESKLNDIDLRKDALMSEIRRRVEESRQFELSQTRDLTKQSEINKKYDSLLRTEQDGADRFFAGQYNDVTSRVNAEKSEVEKRLTEAIQRFTNELSTTSQQSQQNIAPLPPPTGSQQQQTTQSQQPSGSAFDSYYKRPDYQQYSNQASQSSVSGSSIPTNDLIVQDIRREMAARGVVLVPGTSNFSTMMNAIRMQQRNAIIDRIDIDTKSRIGEVDLRKDALMQEVVERVESARQDALSKTNDPIRQADINRYYDYQMKKELGAVDKFFVGQYNEIEQQAQSEKNEVEQRLTEAIQRLTEELSQGNEDSYLNNLRSKYQEAVKRRDDAATEEEAREASREAAKIQERMQRVMDGGSLPSTAIRGITTAAGMTMMGLNGMFNYLHQRDDMAWNLGIEQAGSILSGNAFNAIRQRNMREIAMNEGIGQTVGGVLGGGLGLWGGAALGGKFGASGGPWGAILGAILGAVGGAVGSMAGRETTYYLFNRPKLRENAQVGAADLWRQEEQRMLQFNDLAMLTRGNNPYMQFTRNWYINQSQDPLLKGLMNGEFGNQNKPIVDASVAFNPYNKEGLDLYDLGYTSPEFAQKAAQRIKQRGFVGEDSINNALYADALERVLSLSGGALGQLSAYDRFGRNNANQDFADLATTLASLGTTGMRQGAWARSDEFAGYMSQLQSSQRGTFLTVDNQRAARQVATGQALFGDKFGNEAMQAIQAVNNQVQNPGQGFTRTLLYDIIQELHPDARGDIAKIQKYMYSDEPGVQNEIQVALARRFASIHGSPDTPTGFLAFKSLYGIENPNLLIPIANQMISGGLEAKGLEKANQEELVKPIAQGGYTPEVTKKLNIAADSQMSALLNRMEDMVKISNALLQVLSDDTNTTLNNAVKKLSENKSVLDNMLDALKK